MKALDEFYNEYEEAIRRNFENGTVKNAGGPEFVRGFGDAEARVVLVGEAPGKDEVALGRPFVGKAGGILDEFLEATGIKRDELFITNTSKYRLARERKGGGGVANRPTTAFEIKQGALWLKKEIELIGPDIVVALGNVPLSALREAFLPDLAAKTIGECHGEAAETPVKDKKMIIYPVFHPASLIYNPGNRPAYEQDLRRLKTIMEVLAK